MVQQENIEICNLKNEKPIYEYDIVVDRSNKILGNHAGKGYSRKKAIKLFSDWIQIEMMKKGDVKDEMNRLNTLYNKHKKLRLFCWCNPKSCHSEIIAKYLKLQ